MNMSNALVVTLQHKKKGGWRGNEYQKDARKKLSKLAVNPVFE